MPSLLEMFGVKFLANIFSRDKTAQCTQGLSKNRQYLTVINPNEYNLAGNQTSLINISYDGKGYKKYSFDHEFSLKLAEKYNNPISHLLIFGNMFVQGHGFGV